MGPLDGTGDSYTSLEQVWGNSGAGGRWENWGAVMKHMWGSWGEVGTVTGHWRALRDSHGSDT